MNISGANVRLGIWTHRFLDALVNHGRGVHDVGDVCAKLKAAHIVKELGVIVQEAHFIVETHQVSTFCGDCIELVNCADTIGNVGETVPRLH